ncbi:MAG: oligoribonuclease [Thermoanaerobacteraceae bacterium]|nr:oligoribonuclease [Thermoanaerobacteraceae bacterium]
MAKKTKETVIRTEQEPIYGREELVAAASSFGVKPEVVAGALRLAGKDSMTRTEAEKAIKQFLARRV